MVKKIILIILTTLLLCGCEAKYTLYINSNEIKDELSLKGNGKIQSYEDIPTESELQNTIKVSNIIVDKRKKDNSEYTDIDQNLYKNLEVYNKDFKKLDEGYYELDFNYQFKTISEYKYSELTELLGDQNFYENNENTLTINSSCNNWYVFKRYTQLDIIYFKIVTDYKVIQNNADTVNGNEYTWVIRKDNYGIKEIIIKLDQTKKITDNQRLSSSESNKVINKVLIAIVGIVVLGAIIIGIKVLKSNK